MLYPATSIYKCKSRPSKTDGLLLLYSGVWRNNSYFIFFEAAAAAAIAVSSCFTPLIYYIIPE